MDKITYIPIGVCAKYIVISLNGDLIKDVKFIGGCQGNSEGIARLVRDMNIYDVIKKLNNIKCGNKDTSCPDQLCKALVEYMEKRNEDN